MNYKPFNEFFYEIYILDLVYSNVSRDMPTELILSVESFVTFLTGEFIQTGVN